MYDEGGPPVEVADLINASFPNHLMKQMHKMAMLHIIESDKSVTVHCRGFFRYDSFFFGREILEGLQRVGFKINYGEDGSGFLMLVLKRAGGYYIGAHLSLSPFPNVHL